MKVSPAPTTVAAPESGQRFRLSNPTSSPVDHISIVVPVYNGADYLEPCLRSIQYQTYPCWSATIINNCSTDATGSIAEQFAASDDRFSVVHCTEFVGQSENYNRAIAHASPGSRFIKLVEADNLLWPDCLSQLHAVAQSDDKIGVVGCYYLFGRKLRGTGVPLDKKVISGREAARIHLNSEAYMLGTPTTLLYRAEAIKRLNPCFRPGLLHDDVDLCMRIFADWDFGFAHQVLAFIRADNEGIMSQVMDCDFGAAQTYFLARDHAARFFSPQEARVLQSRMRRRYLRRLGSALWGLRGERYWRFHRKAFAAAGESIPRAALIGPAFASLLEHLLNPKLTFESVVRQARQRRAARSGS